MGFFLEGGWLSCLKIWNTVPLLKKIENFLGNMFRGLTLSYRTLRDHSVYTGCGGRGSKWPPTIMLCLRPKIKKFNHNILKEKYSWPMSKIQNTPNGGKQNRHPVILTKSVGHAVIHLTRTVPVNKKLLTEIVSVNKIYWSKQFWSIRNDWSELFRSITSFYKEAVHQ